MQKQQMKKIKYGNRDKTKEKRNMHLEGLKDGDDDVCGAVLDSFSDDYLSYITGLVKASKTPSKMRTQQRIQGLFQANAQKQKKKLVTQQPVNVVSQVKSKQISPKSPQSYSDLKNSTLPMKNIKGFAETNQVRKHRDKSVGSAFQNVEKYHQLKIDRNFANKQYYNRFPTQQAEKPFKQNKFDQTSIVLSQESEPRLGRNEPGKQFLEGLNQYLVTLESHRPAKKSQIRKNSGKSKINDDQIRNVEQLLQENIKLRRKIRKYEQKMNEIEQNMENHFMQAFVNQGSHCKRQQKSQKTKINDLTKALLRAVTKVNQQKEQIQSMKYELKSFGRKAQYCAQKYEQESSQQQQIHQSLIKAMRPTRACSQYKLKKKMDLPYLQLINKKQ